MFCALFELILFTRGPAKHVLLGELDYSVDDDSARPIVFTVAERIKYPSYSTKFKYDDIALLRLDGNLTFNEYIRPACLPEFSFTGILATATGWGQIGYHGPASTYLQKVDISLYAHQDCNQVYQRFNDRHINRGIINETQLCAVSYVGNGDTCQVSLFNKNKVYTILNFKSDSEF